MHTHAQTQCHLLEVVVSQQVAGPQHVVVCEVWVQGASGVGPFSALSNLLGDHDGILTVAYTSCRYTVRDMICREHTH